MKTLFACSVMLLLTTPLTHGQAVKSSLANDPNFRQALSKTMRYPVAAQREQKVAKAYVEFKVDSRGKVIDVQVLNQANVNAFFKEEIHRFMSQLPAQKQTYAGTYVLPIVFELEGKGGVIKPREEDITFTQSLHKELLLKDAYVTAYLN
jgi:TonB family protein